MGIMLSFNRKPREGRKWGTAAIAAGIFLIWLYISLPYRYNEVKYTLNGGNDHVKLRK